MGTAEWLALGLLAVAALARPSAAQEYVPAGDRAKAPAALAGAPGQDEPVRAPAGAAADAPQVPPAAKPAAAPVASHRAPRPAAAEAAPSRVASPVAAKARGNEPAARSGRRASGTAGGRELAARYRARASRSSRPDPAAGLAAQPRSRAIEVGRRSADEILGDRKSELDDKYHDEIAANEMVVTIGRASQSVAKRPRKKDLARILQIREALAGQAQLDARAGIIEAIETRFTAERRLDIPGTSVEQRFSSERAALEDRLESAGAHVRALLEASESAASALDAAVLDDLEDEPLLDRPSAALRSVVAPLDGVAPADEVARIRGEYQAIQEQAEALRKKISEDSAGPSTEIKTAAAALSAMPLLGAVVVDSAESYLEGVYEVAVLEVWSARLERGARAIMAGEPTPAAAPAHPRSIRDVLSSFDLASSFGSRQFVDEGGRRVFLGFGSVPQARAGPARTAAIEMSKLRARANLAYALFGDIVSFRAARERVSLRDRGEGQTTDVQYVAELQKTVSEQVRDIQMPFARIVEQREVEHPLTHGKLFVTVMAMDPAGSAKAREFLARAYADYGAGVLEQARRRGFHQGLAASVPGEGAAAGAERRGEAEGRAAYQRRRYEREAAPVAKAAPAAPHGAAPGAGGLELHEGGIHGGGSLDNL